MPTKILPNGVKVVDSDTHIGLWVAQQGLVHDNHMSGIIRNIIQRHQVRACVDAGANIGTLTRVMIDAGCRVDAFEPDPELFECLIHNCPELLASENAAESHKNRAFMTGLGEADTFGYRYIKDQNAGASHFVPAEKGETGVVTVTSLDWIRNTLGLECQLIKMDVEGMELDILAGAGDLIFEQRPVLLLEVNSGAMARHGHCVADLTDWLQCRKYRPTICQPQCDWNSPQFDIICEP